MRYGSICSGIEAASVAWEPLGWKPAWFAEVNPFCNAVLAHHWPAVPNLGDITNDRFTERAGDIDLLVGGTPCQSFSTAGLRKGLSDPRGGLTLRFLEIAASLRPKWVVWENVPGVLSQDRGRAFGAFLGGLEELGYGWAYRVMDAQFFGVPQRRRRVFVVGCLGDVGASEVLFECKSYDWHLTTRKSKQQASSSTARSSVVPMAFYSSGGSWGAVEGPLCPPLKLGSGVGISSNLGVLTIDGVLRALTPIEYERLQGFPDNHTAVRLVSHEVARDNVRYEALGNSMAVPVMRWIGQRIDLVTKSLTNS